MNQRRNKREIKKLRQMKMESQHTRTLGHNKQNKTKHKHKHTHTHTHTHTQTHKKKPHKIFFSKKNSKREVHSNKQLH